MKKNIKKAILSGLLAFSMILGSAGAQPTEAQASSVNAEQEATSNKVTVKADGITATLQTKESIYYASLGETIDLGLKTKNVDQITYKIYPSGSATVSKSGKITLAKEGKTEVVIKGFVKGTKKQIATHAIVYVPFISLNKYPDTLDKDLLGNALVKTDSISFYQPGMTYCGYAFVHAAKKGDKITAKITDPEIADVKIYPASEKTYGANTGIEGSTDYMTNIVVTAKKPGMAKLVIKAPRCKTITYNIYVAGVDATLHTIDAYADNTTLSVKMYGVADDIRGVKPADDNTVKIDWISSIYLEETPLEIINIKVSKTAATGNTTTLSFFDIYGNTDTVTINWKER